MGLQQEGRPNSAASASPFPGSSPSWLPPSLSLSLNLLYNFKIKLKKKQERESTEGKIPPTISLQGGEKVSAYVKKKKKNECKGSLKSLSTE